MVHRASALLMDSDQIVHEQAPDARWAHWLIWNLPPDTASLPERVATTTKLAAFGPDTRQGTNDYKAIGYSGPCPLPVTTSNIVKQKIVFEYLFRVYALDTLLGIPGGATRDEFLQAIDGHILSGGVIRGEFVASRQMPLQVY
jgi:Raf kinase inhibitor-like YbhB/YbcL family protein